MNVFTTANRIIVTCSNRLSPFLQQEVVELGFTPVRIFKTGIELKGNLADCIKLNLNLRCASQVLFSVKEFTAHNAEDLYKTLLDFEWENKTLFFGLYTRNQSYFANSFYAATGLPLGKEMEML